jgi:hypothetical protein
MHPLHCSALRRLSILALALLVATIGQAQVPSGARTGHSTDSRWLQERPRHPLPTDPLRAKALPKEAKSLASQSYVVDTAIVANNSYECYYPYVMRCLFAFDAQGKRVSELYQYREWDSPNQQFVWPNDFRCTSTYDAQGNRLSYLEQWWSEGQWQNSDRLTSTYDGQGNEVSRLEEWWANGQWVNFALYTYTYDAGGNMLSQLGTSWSSYRSAWVNDARYTYDYDGSGNQLSRLTEYYAADHWANATLESYSYDAQGNVLCDSSWWWADGQWVKGPSHAYTYDAYGNPATTYGPYDQPTNHTYTYDVGGRMKVDSTNHARATFSYDAHGNVTIWSLDIYFNTHPGGWGGFPQEANLAFIDGGGYAHSYWGVTDTLHYRMITTAVISEGETAPQQYSLSQNYPNPFNPKTGFRFQVPGVSDVKLTVYDLLGREVAVLVNERKIPGSYEVTFDGSGLASGVYIYRMTAGSFTESKKMVLVK